jgi:hypothetical protein
MQESIQNLERIPNPDKKCPEDRKYFASSGLLSMLVTALLP